MTMTADTILSMMTGRQIDIDELAQELERLDIPARVKAVRAISGRNHARIWDACAGRGTTLEDLVPADYEPAVPVIHHGKNSLPAFNFFQKPFARSAEDPNVLYGYNEGSTRALIGPGYFVAHYYDERGEVGINYYDVPPQGARLPESWPKVKPNESGLQRFVFASMIDYLRKVAEGVTIGRAVRKGKATSNYFMLVREAV